MHPDPPPRGLRQLFRPRVPDAVAAELEFHVAMRAAELIAAGVESREAQRQARAHFANLPQIAAECRRIGGQTERTMRRTEYLGEFLDDTRFAWRQLVKAPGFAIVAIATLALGIAATTVIFSAVDAVLLRRFSYAHPERTVLVNEMFKGQDGNVSAGNFVDWTTMAHSFSAMGAEGFKSFNLATPDAPERVFGANVTAGYFTVFGVAPILGRVFSDAEDQPGNDGVVLLGETTWRTRYAADPAILGREIQLDGRPRTVIGVMPADFDPVVAGEQLWVPAAFTPERRAMHDEHYLNVYATLKPGTTVAQAQADMSAVMRIQAERFPQDAGAGGSHVINVAGSITAAYRTPLLLLQGAVLLVLLIACGNVASLQLARSASRVREMAIRAAIGAGRGRIARQLLTENLILAMLAGTAAVVLSRFGIAALVANAPAGIPRLDQARIGVVVVLFAGIAALLSAVVSGLAPALRLSRRDLQSTLRDAGRQTQGSVRDRVRTVLIVAEVALALPVLTGAGLLLRSAMHLQRIDPGFDMTGVLTARTILPAGSAEQNVQLLRQLVDNVSHRTGITAASVTSQAPMGPGGGSNGLLPEGVAFDRSKLVDAQLRLVTPEYLAALKLRLRQGRFFTAQDVNGSTRAMVISEALAKALWPGQDPIGKRVSCCEGTPEDPRLKTVIGVVGDVRSGGPTADVVPEFYLPVDQAPADAWGWVNRTMTIVVRGSASDIAGETAAIRAAVHEVMPAAPVYRFTPMHDELRTSTAVEHFNTVLLIVLGLVGLLLAAIGIYGVVGYFVTLRTHEIGVRMALGADARNILRLLAWQGIRPILIGLAGGAVLTTWSATLLRTSLFGVDAHDPITFAVVATVLVGTGFVATMVPALRATRVDPSRTLQ